MKEMLYIYIYRERERDVDVGIICVKIFDGLALEERERC